jgi:hypothetical protein
MRPMRILMKLVLVATYYLDGKDVYFNYDIM